VTWIVIAGLSLFPLMLSVGRMEAQHQEKTLLSKAALMLKGSLSLQESEPFLIWVLMGLLLAAFILSVMAGPGLLLFGLRKTSCKKINVVIKANEKS